MSIRTHAITLLLAATAAATHAAGKDTITADTAAAQGKTSFWQTLYKPINWIRRN